MLDIYHQFTRTSLRFLSIFVKDCKRNIRFVIITADTTNKTKQIASGSQQPFSHANPHPQILGIGSPRTESESIATIPNTSQKKVNPLKI
jgi:hypothetical protein